MDHHHFKNFGSHFLPSVGAALGLNTSPPLMDGVLGSKAGFNLISNAMF